MAFKPLRDLSPLAVRHNDELMVGLRIWDPETKRIEARYLPENWIIKAVAHKTETLHQTEVPCTVITFADRNGDKHRVTTQTSVSEMLYWIAKLDTRKGAEDVWIHTN